MPKTVPVLPGIQPGRSAYSQVVEANGLVFVAGQVGEDHATGTVATGRDRGRDPGDVRQRRPPAWRPSV